MWRIRGSDLRGRSCDPREPLNSGIGQLRVVEHNNVYILVRPRLASHAPSVGFRYAGLLFYDTSLKSKLRLAALDAAGSEEQERLIGWRGEVPLVAEVRCFPDIHSL